MVDDEAHRAGTVVALLTLATLGCTVVGFAGATTGGTVLFGTAAAGERNALLGGIVVGCLLAVVLLLVAGACEAVIGRPTTAMAGFVAGCAFAMPAAVALGTSVSVPALADVSDCGTLTTPTTTFVVPDQEAAVAGQCRDRLAEHRLLVGALALPALGTVVVSVGGLVRPRRSAGSHPAGQR